MVEDSFNLSKSIKEEDKQNIFNKNLQLSIRIYLVSYKSEILIYKIIEFCILRHIFN